MSLRELLLSINSDEDSSLPFKLESKELLTVVAIA